MNPAHKGWLKEFLNYRRKLFLRSKSFEKIKKSQHPDQTFYGLIQPTGIMYGYPIHFYDLEMEEKWQPIDTIKVLLADSFINIAELYHGHPVKSEEELSELMFKTMESVNHFYNGVYPEIAVSTTNWLGRKRDVLLTTEKILEKRVAVIFKQIDNFWAQFFHNNQLFLDIYIFGQWSHMQPDQILLDFFRQEKEELSYTAVKVMAAASHANEHLENEEKKLFEHFITNSGLPAEKKRVATEYFEHGLGIQDIPVEDTDPWVIRKFFLELAILTVWSDKKIESIEWAFLNNFNASLGFSEEDFDSSMIAVEGFVLQNWNQLDSLQVKKDHHEIGLDYIERVSKVVKKYKDRIKSHIAEDKELQKYLLKQFAPNLTAQEKEKVKKKLIDILKVIPNFRIVAVPKDFLTYEMLLKIIPDDVFLHVKR